MPAFTPGPWRVGPTDDTMVTAAGGAEVAACAGDYSHPDTWPVMEANARLIAAAPDLLRVAELLVSWLDEDEGAHKLCDTARAAIRLAETGERGQ